MILFGWSSYMKSYEKLFEKSQCRSKCMKSLLGRTTSQLQNWAFLTYLHGKPKRTYIYSMQERQNVNNTSRHQEVAVSLLNLPYYSHFSCPATLNVRSEKLWFLQLWRYSSGEAKWNAVFRFWKYFASRI